MCPGSRESKLKTRGTIRKTYKAVRSETMLALA